MKEKINSLQLIRFIAAFLVVITHSIDRMKHYSDEPFHIVLDFFHKFGSSGVDMFFIISGFVMMYISSASIANGTFDLKRFYIKRLVRVVPIYWIITAIVSILLIVYPSVFYNTTTDIYHTLGSYFFIPIADPLNKFAPLLGVGWTLNLEMYFYLIFGLFIFFFKLNAFKYIICFFIVTSLIGFILQLGKQGYYLNVLTNPMFLEFIFGMVLFKIMSKREFTFREAAVLLILSISIYTVPIFVSFDISIRFIYWGVPSFLLILSMITFEKLGKLKVSSFFIKLGDASYSIYLTHYFAIGLLYKIGDDIGWLQHPTVFILIAIILSTFIGYIFYILVEKPILKLLTRQGNYMNVI
jgi:exopolysaccharide production protein ExoZ